MFDNMPNDLSIVSSQDRPVELLTDSQIASQNKAGMLDIGSMLVGLLRDNYKMGDAQPFLKTGAVNITTTAFTDIVTFTVPESCKGVLKFFGQGAATVLAFDELTWQLTVNGNPAIDLGSFTVQLGSIATPKLITIRVKSNDVIALKAKIATTAYIAHGLLEGWYWSE